MWVNRKSLAGQVLKSQSINAWFWGVIEPKRVLILSLRMI